MFQTLAVRGLLAVALLLACPAAAQVSTWDAARDFSGAQNPNPPWTYGWKASAASALNVFPTYEAAASPVRDAWQDFGRSNLLGVYHNSVGVTGDIPTNMLLLAPASDLAVVAWTAPANMPLHVQGMFRSLDTTAAQVTIVSSVSGTRFSGSVNSGAANSSFGLFLNAVAGERLDFVVSGGAAGVNVVISAMSLVADAKINDLVLTDTRLRLTSNANNQGGTAWTVSKQRVDDGFDTSFLFQISQLTGGGADGFSFIIQNSSVMAYGGPGGAMGYHLVPASLAVEFDTYQNSMLGDPNGNHIGVHTQGVNPNSAYESASIARTTSIPNMKDGQWHSVRILYAGQQLSIYMDNAMVLQKAVDLVSTLQLADGMVWVGFGAGTGGATEVHDIQSWHFFSYDLHAPVLTVPSLAPVEGNTLGGANVSFTASASDAVDGPRPVECTPAGGTVFPVGNTTVLCSSTDLSNNTGHASFVVTVKDTTAPTVVVPLAVTASAVDSKGAPVSYAATANDIVDGEIVPACLPASGSKFPLGTTTVTCTATDHAGNSASQTFLVDVVDQTPPVISGLANIQLEATGPLTAVSWPGVTASDNVDGAVAVVCNPVSGTNFAVGSATVQCSATDKAGNQAAGSFVVTVQDTKAPVISCGSADGLWHAGDVTIACSAHDGGAGLAKAADASFFLTTNVAAGTETANATTNSRTVCDAVGNCATAGPVGGNAVDKRAPTITISAPADAVYLLHQPVMASYACTDAGSGTATCSGLVANGAQLDTASVGAKQFTVNASDKVGNTSSLSVGYSVGFNVQVLGNGVPKQAGSTIPVRLELRDYAGKNVSSPALEVFASGMATAAGPMLAPQDAGKANPGMRFRYIGSRDGGAYMFNLQTRGMTPGVYQLLVHVGGDATPYPIAFQLVAGRD